MDRVPKKPGPKPINGRPMTAAERMKRHRAKQVLLAQCAKDSEYMLTTVLLDKRQLSALAELSWHIGEGRERPTLDRLNNWLFYAIKGHIKRGFESRGLELPEDLPQFDHELDTIQFAARDKFNQLMEKEFPHVSNNQTS